MSDRTTDRIYRHTLNDIDECPSALYSGLRFHRVVIVVLAVTVSLEIVKIYFQTSVSFKLPLDMICSYGRHNRLGDRKISLTIILK